MDGAENLTNLYFSVIFCHIIILYYYHNMERGNNYNILNDKNNNNLPSEEIYWSLQWLKDLKNELWMNIETELMNKIIHIKDITKDKNWMPIIVRHWSLSCYDNFYWISHFWTLKAAKDRIKDKEEVAILDIENQILPQIYACALTIKKPIILNHDIGDEYSSDGLIENILKTQNLNLNREDRALLMWYYCKFSIGRNNALLNKFKDDINYRSRVIKWKKLKTESEISNYVQNSKKEINDLKETFDKNNKIFYQTKKVEILEELKNTFKITNFSSNNKFLIKYLLEKDIHDCVIYKNEVEDKWSQSIIIFSSKSIVPLVRKNINNNSITNLI